MDKKTLQQRLKNLEQLKENHLQDMKEIEYVMDGMKKQIEEIADDDTQDIAGLSVGS